jgi:hypothetical protein
MNGAHDLGGMHGFGPVEIEKGEPVFHFVPEQEMERRVQDWDAAARATPHGKPVELVNRMSKPLEESNDQS